MAANLYPIYVGSSCLTMVQIATANTNRDGTGTMGTVLTGDADGTLVDMIRICAAGTVTNGVVRFFLSTDSGTTKRLLDEIIVSATTPSVTVKVFTAEWLPSRPLVLASASQILYASTHNAEAFNVFPFGGHY